ncbi:MAG: hypothetical protein E7500_05230 [Ruminococcus sp.]|nr:hypothetical protein [Ruminococcus sp.]
MSYYIAEQIDLGIDKLIDGTADDSIVKLMKKIYKTGDSDVILQAVYLLYQICIEKKPFEECKKRMDLLLSAELERSERNDCVNLISWASRTFYDIKTFSMFWEYLEKSAIPLTNLENSILLYWLSKYYTGDEELKKTATENLIALNFSASCSAVYQLLIFYTGNKEIIKAFRIKNAKYFNNSLFDDFMYTFITEKNTSMIKLLLSAGYEFDIDLVLEIAVKRPKLYSDYLAVDFLKELPPVFKIQNTKLRSVKDLIPFLFKSKTYNNYIVSDSEFYSISRSLVFIHLYRLLGKHYFKKISGYFPVMGLTIGFSIYELINADDEFIDILLSKTSETVILVDNGMLFLYSIAELEALKKKLKGKRIEVTTDFLSRYNDADDIIKILDLFENRVISIFDDDNKYYQKIINLDNKRLMEKAVECGIVYYECYEEAIEYAVEQKKYNSLDVLNKKYAELNLNNMDLWGRLTYEELD